MKKQQKGFTLVELAIALMVIGLLIGGVLKGQELIENARMIKIVRDFHDFRTATQIFRSTYNAIPGDFKFPDRITNCQSDECREAGNGDGIFSGISPRAIPHIPLGQQMQENHEVINFWRHLEAAGMLSNMLHEVVMNGNRTVPVGKSPIESMLYVPNSYTSVVYGDPLNGSSNFMLLRIFNDHLIANGLTGRQATQLDEKIDDGKPFSGDARAFGVYYGTIPVTCADTSDVTGNHYVTDSKEKTCHFGVSLN